MRAARAVRRAVGIALTGYLDQLLAVEEQVAGLLTVSPREHDGIWGGATEKERRRIVRQRRKSA